MLEFIFAIIVVCILLLAAYAMWQNVKSELRPKGCMDVIAICADQPQPDDERSNE